MRILSLILVLGISLTLYGQNYLANGSFEQGMKNWRLYTDQNGSLSEATVVTENAISGQKSVRFVILSSGTEPSDSRFETYFTTHKDREIAVRYKIRANRESFYNLEICRNYLPDSALYRSTETDSANLPIGTIVQDINFTLIPGESDGNIRISFLLGNLNSRDTLWLDDISIEETQTVWDENIIPNFEFNEFRDPDPGFPEYRKKRLFWGQIPNSDGGWEGGFCYDPPTEILFDIDTNGVLSGKNSAYIHITHKEGTDFFNGAYTGFFQATQGTAYELSFEAVASENITLSVAMNRQPFSNLESDPNNVGPPYYDYAPDRFFYSFTITPEKQTFTVKSDTLLTHCMHQIFFANYPNNDVEFWIDNVELRRVESPYTGDPSDTLTPGYSGNPLIRQMFTADPAALVYSDTFYIYTGHDEQAMGVEGYFMRDWHVFSSVDLINWYDHGAVLRVSDFSWARADAWAGHCVEKDGKFYWYVPMNHNSIEGFSIGVAVSDHPAGPFVDAKGSALITNDMTTNLSILWDDIDPAVFVDDDGQAYIYWGNSSCKYAKLKSNMIELDGPIQYITLPMFTEAPWVHKRNGLYYLSYASRWPEYIDYATGPGPEGPWTHRGRLNDYVENCSTNHQAILEFNGEWYFVYHNGSLPTGGDFRRSVCLDRLYYNDDGTMQEIVQTIRGVPEVVLGTENYVEPEKEVFIFPNPLYNESLKITIPEAKPKEMADVMIVDSLGRKIFQERYPSGTTVIIGLSVGPGLYMVNLSIDRKTLSNKLIVL